MQWCIVDQQEKWINFIVKHYDTVLIPPYPVSEMVKSPPSCARSRSA